MNEILQVIGSLASICAVPLAVYIYLKTKLHAYSGVRREIVRRLSHQIGENRTITFFELRAVIDSLSRENQLPPGSITPDSIVDDLVAETVSSPLLDSSKKDSLVRELEAIHTSSQVDMKVLDEPQQLEGNQEDDLDDTVRLGRRENETRKLQRQESKIRKTETIANTFGFVAASIGIGASVASFSDFAATSDIVKKILELNFPVAVLIGVIVSIVAGTIAGIVAKYKNSI